MKQYEITEDIKDAVINLLQDCYISNKTVRQVAGIINILQSLPELVKTTKKETIEK